MKKKPESRAVPEETRVAKQKSLTKNDCDDRDVDRISDVAIKASHNELFWRRDRRGRPEPLQRKSGKRIHHSGRFDDDQYAAEDAGWINAEKSRLEFPLRNPPGHEARQPQRRNDEEQ